MLLHQLQVKVTYWTAAMSKLPASSRIKGSKLNLRLPSGKLLLLQQQQRWTMQRSQVTWQLQRRQQRKRPTLQRHPHPCC
jgi:hypothetical protein